MRISDWSSDVCSSDLRHAANPVFAAVLVEPRAPEAILLVRPLDRHAEIVGERLRLAAMIDLAVGEQDLLARDAMMRGRRLPFRQIAAGIDEGALHSLGSTKDRKRVLEGKGVPVRVDIG